MGFLVPENWHASQSASKDGLGFRFGREDPKKGEPLITGLTINVIQDVTRKTNVKPSLYAAHFAERYTKDLEVTKKPASIHIGKFDRLEFEVKKRQSQTGVDLTYRIHVHAVANDSTDTLYIIIFGALDRDWDEEWKLGREILRLYFIDDEF